MSDLAQNFRVSVRSQIKGKVFTIAVQRSRSICMEKMPETLEMDRVLEKRKTSERHAETTEVKQEKCSEDHPDDECSEKPPVKSQYENQFYVYMNICTCNYE